MQFADKKEYAAFCREATAAMAEVAEKYGVTVRFGNGRYNDQAATMKLEVTNKTATGEAQDKSAIDFKALAPLYGLVAEDLGREFRRGGKTFKISGLNRRAKTMPILAKCLQDGKTYKFAEDIVTLALKK